MQPDLAAGDSLVSAWRTTNRVTTFLLESLPPELWTAPVPGVPRRTVRNIAAHLHNSRRTWIRTLGGEHGVRVPAAVDRNRVSVRQLVAALGRSSRGIAALLELGCVHGGTLPPSAAYVWRNLPLDVGHVLAYFVAHEGHHRGQIVLIARQLGLRLPPTIANGLWDWTKRRKESRT